MSLTRRAAMLGGLGVGGAGLTLGGLHWNWSRKTFARDGFDPAPPIAPQGESSWMNWSGHQRSTPQRIAFPRSESELAELVASTPDPVRPVGSGHSFSALVPSEGTIVDVSGLEGLLDYDSETGLARFAAGTRLFHAASELDKVGRAFPNLPDIDVQTLGGTFATATHGTGDTLSALHDYIEGFRLVTANGDVVEVNRQSDPDLFAAGKVSLGVLGVMSDFTVNTVPAYKLHRKLTVEPIADFYDKIESLGAAHRNFEFFYFPGTGQVAWLTHQLFEGPIDETDSAAPDDEDFLIGLKQLRDTFGWFPWLRRTIAASSFPTGLIEDRRDDSFALLSTVRPVKFNEMEYHLPRENGVATLRKIVSMLDSRGGVFFPLEYRHVASDTAWLSPFNSGPCASIAIHAAVDEHFDFFFSEFEPVFLAAGGRPHWGKLNSLTNRQARDLYPYFLAFDEIRDTLDPTGKFLNPYLAELFGADHRA
ncbi:MAG: D-arabinono-1,4-lactone oxidase [Pseudomonadota bacterium]